MALSIGIVGLPNVGKSTMFNALTCAQNAQAANYPFCTIEPNKANVAVPDDRIDHLAKIVNPQRVMFSQVEFVDIAGLVKGASKGEGLGNKFLANIREASALVHVVRCFEDENVIHVDGTPNPKKDIDVINTELIFADLEQLEKKIERLGKLAKTGKKDPLTMAMAQALKDLLEKEQPISEYEDRDDETYIALCAEMRFITAKVVIYAANVDEDTLSEDNQLVRDLRKIAQNQNAKVVKICAKLEEEMVDMSPDECAEFLEDLGVQESGLRQIIHQGFDALGLMSYFTAGEKEVRAWTVGQGWTAPQCAGVIHTDFEKGFIRAEVINFDAYIAHQGESGAKAAGEMQTKGKDYIMQDGDVVHFLFNV